MKTPVPMRYVRMIDNATAAARDNPTLRLQYERSMVYHLDESTAQSFIRRGLAEPGRVIETIVSDENGASTEEFHFIPDGDEPGLPAGPSEGEVVPFAPAATPTPVAKPTGGVPEATQAPTADPPPTQQPSKAEAEADAPDGKPPSRAKRRGGFSAQPDAPKR